MRSDPERPPLHVLQLGPYPPPHGGVQANLTAIRQFLLERQIPCTVINLTRHRRANTGDVYYPKTALQVLWLLVRLRYDVVHLHIGGNLSFRLLALGLVCSLLPGKKSVLTFHSGGYPSSEAGRSARPGSVPGFVLRRFDTVVAVNQEIANLLVKFGVSRDRIRLIPPFAVQQSLADAPLPEALEEFLRSHTPVLTTVGGLEPEYDLPTQIELLGLVRRRHPGAGLAIIGSGGLEADLRRQIESTPYMEHILLCGDVPHAATLRAIAASDVVLRTTLYDGDSVAVREALRLAGPVIATDNGMRPDGVDLVPPSDLGTLHHAVEQRLAQAGPRECDRGTGEENLESVHRTYETLLDEVSWRQRAGGVLSTLLGFLFTLLGLPRE